MAVLNDAWESKPAEKDALPPLEMQPEEVDLMYDSLFTECFGDWY